MVSSSLDGGPQIVTLSARTPAALDRLIAAWERFLTCPPPEFALADAAWTTQAGAPVFAHRMAIAAENPAALVDALAGRNQRRCARATATEVPPPVVFMFPGSGAPFVGAGRGLEQRLAAFRAAVDACFAAMPASAPPDLRALMFETADDDRAAAAALAQPLCGGLAAVVLSVAMARLWQSWGVTPAAVVGDGVGEYAAAVVAGVMSVKDALALVARRGLIMERTAAGGPPEGSDVTDFQRHLAGLTLRGPAVPFACCWSGDFARPREVRSPDRWVRNLCEPGPFTGGLAAVLRRPGVLLLDVGPGRTLAGGAGAGVASMRAADQPDDDHLVALTAAGRLWAHGVPLAFAAVRGEGERRHLSLPTPAPDDLAAERKPDKDDFASSAEATIARIGAEVLGLSTLGPEDNFLFLGGNSLTGARLFAGIRKELGVTLSLSVLFRAPTVRQLARLVAENRGSSSPSAPMTARATRKPWSPLVPIAAGLPGRRPLFCVHGAGGNVLVFKPLADQLASGTPFFGLEAQGVDGRLPFQETIEAMAESYLDAIRAIAPTGPYRLAGYSGGGVVAYEMAQRLVRGGEKVECLVMFDTLAPEERRRPPSFWDVLTLMLRIHPRYLLMWPQRQWTNLLRRRRVHQAQAGRISTTVTAFEVLGARLFEAFGRAQERYQPQPYPGRLLMFYATYQSRYFRRAGPTLGWDHLVQGGIESIPVSGWHETLFEPPATEVMARVLGQRLAQLDQAELG